jgi:hypothetical protein
MQIVMSVSSEYVVSIGAIILQMVITFNIV